MKHVLVVDDSAVVRKVARLLLESLQIHAEEASDGETALVACDKHMPDAVIVDWRMPGMDAMEFTQTLRRRPGGQGTKILFCTSQNDVAHIARAMHAGATDYLLKPFDKRLMMSKLEEIGLA